MNTSRTLAALVFATCAAAFPSAAAAQPAFGPSADVSVGFFVGAGGGFADRGGPALDGIVGLPVSRMRSGTVGAVAGVQRAIGPGLSARALAGPAYFQDANGDDTFGLQGRVDVAKRLILRTVLVASVRGSLLPRYQDQTLGYATFGLGLRIQ